MSGLSGRTKIVDSLPSLRGFQDRDVNIPIELEIYALFTVGETNTHHRPGN